MAPARNASAAFASNALFARPNKGDVNGAGGMREQKPEIHDTGVGLGVWPGKRSPISVNLTCPIAAAGA